MALPRNEPGPQRLRSVPLFDNLHVENSFEDSGVAGQQVLDLLALEDDVTHSASEVKQLTSCVISTLLPTCRSITRVSLCSCWT